MKKELLQTLLAFSLIFLVSFYLSGCKTCKPETIYRDSTVYKLRVDTTNIYKHDSIYIFRNGDTLTVKEYHTRYLYKNKIQTDSFYIDKVKTVPFEVIKKVVPEWCYYLLAGAILLVIYWIVKLVLWVRKKFSV